jgi:hypothetical protein
LQADFAGHVLVNGLNDRRRRILADGIHKRTSWPEFRTQHGQPRLQRLPAHIVEADQFERRRVNRRARRWRPSYSLRLTRLFVGHRDTFSAASHKLHESFERASLLASLKGFAPDERSVLSTALKRLVFEPPGRLSKAIPMAKNSTFVTVITETSCRESVGISEQPPQTGLAGLRPPTNQSRQDAADREFSILNVNIKVDEEADAVSLSLSLSLFSCDR